MKWRIRFSLDRLSDCEFRTLREASEYIVHCYSDMEQYTRTEFYDGDLSFPTAPFAARVDLVRNDGKIKSSRFFVNLPNHLWRWL